MRWQTRRSANHGRNRPEGGHREDWCCSTEGERIPHPAFGHPLPAGEGKMARSVWALHEPPSQPLDASYAEVNEVKATGRAGPSLSPAAGLSQQRLRAKPRTSLWCGDKGVDSRVCFLPGMAGRRMIIHRYRPRKCQDRRGPDQPNETGRFYFALTRILCRLTTYGHLSTLAESDLDRS